MKQNTKTTARRLRAALGNLTSFALARICRLVLAGMLAFGGFASTFTPECRGNQAHYDVTRPTFDQEVYDKYKAKWDDVAERYRKILDALDEELKKASPIFIEAATKYHDLLNRKNRDDITDPWTQGDEADLQQALNSMNAKKAVVDTIFANIFSELGARSAVLGDLREAYIDEQYTEDHAHWGIY